MTSDTPRRDRTPAPLRGAPMIGLLLVAMTMGTGCIVLDAALLGGYPDDALLRGRTFGPYRGRVVDRETGAPLAGAAVMAVWQQRRNGIAHSVVRPYAAREVLTDAAGRFVLDARELEEGAPWTTEPPQFWMFLPGYQSYQMGHFDPTWPVPRDFARVEPTVALRPLRTDRERREALPWFGGTFSRRQFTAVPRFMGLVNAERRRLGWPPLTERSWD